MGTTRNLAWGGMLACSVLAGAAQAAIYTCVDAKGRRLTSDRPIAECMDREQTEVSPSGAKRTLKPSLTAVEAAQEEEKARKAADEARRAAEEKQRQKLLLARYPDRAAHDSERSRALVAMDNVIAAANKRVGELHMQRAKLAQETEFYKADPSKLPPQLKRQIDEADQQMAAQQRFIASQDEEKRRVHARFDAELAQLQQLWAAAPRPAKP